MDITNCDNAIMKMRYRHLEDVVVEDKVSDQLRQERERPFSYNHLSDSDQQTVEQLMAGKVKDIPSIKSKVIKVFISSTFTDMIEERNALAENVYPKLRDYCRDKYGVDFQAVDMRWGISSEASNDHSVIDLCMSEIKHCQELSIGPNFAVLVGQKYGFCPVPPAIVRASFVAIYDQLKNNKICVDALDKCYNRDQNVNPSMYRLLEKDTCVKLMGKPWDNIEMELKEKIQEGGQLAVKNSELSQESYRLLTCSVTEQEIHYGMLGNVGDGNRKDNAVAFFRDLQDLFDNLQDAKAKRFCDVAPNSLETDGDAMAALNIMRANLMNSLPKFNTATAKIKWIPEGIDPKIHKDYLGIVCNHFYHTIKALADRNMQNYSSLASDPLYHEVVQHWTLIKTRNLTFVGRDEQLEMVKTFLNSDTTQPLVIYGESGVGKTSFSAKAAHMASSLLSMKTFVIPRFIGITPLSSNIQQLLYSVCHQLAIVTGGYRHEIPEDYKSLKLYFIDKIQKGDFPGVVVIFLDSLDQLNTSNSGDKLDWLPARVAPNVKIIVSTLPHKRGILERLVSKIKQPMIEITAPPASDCEAIVKVLLESVDRSVTLPQWRIIQDAFKHCTLPLFITLTFEEATRWRSFDEIHPGCLEYTIEASVNKLFDRLEAKHGKVFVSRAMGYVTAARNGLSETELEDILSLDDHVLNDLFTMWLPPIRRIPPSLWPRLYLDIQNFLVEREVDGIVVLSWYHQQFLDSATDRYLSEYLDYNQIHRNIADYYMGCWSGTLKKPFMYTEQIMKRYKLSYPHGIGCRFVPDQPLIYKANEISERFNYRKMSQLPYSLIHSCQFDKVKLECLCNYEWLHTKLRATSIQQVISDFSLLEDRESDLVADVLRMTGSALMIDPDALGPEITGRLLPHVHRYHWIKELVKQCDLVSQRRCPLVPNCQIYTAPGGPLQYECELDENITSSIDVDVFNTQDGILMTAKPFYSTCLKVWELTQGEPRQDMRLPVGEVYPNRDGTFLSILKGSRQVLIYNTDGGELHGKIDCEYGDVVSVAIGNRYLAFNIDRGVGPYVMDLQEAKLVHKFTNHSHAVAINNDESHLAFNSGNLVLIHSLPLMERRCVGQASDLPQQLAFTKHANMCYILTQSKLLQVMTFDPINRKSSTSDVIMDLDSKEFMFSHEGSFILVRALRCLYLICAKKHKLLHRLMRAHPGVFVETMTTFTGAGFSPKDDMVVASRYTYIFVWSTKTGDPIRVLQASISPILKIYTSDTVNKAVALLKDNTLQVWNLDNLDANILHANELVKGQIKSLALSCATEKILCHGHKHSEVKVVDMCTGKAVSALIQGEDVKSVSKVMFCIKGKYAVTRNIRGEVEESNHYGLEEEIKITINWEALNDDVVWSMETEKPVFKLTNNRFVVTDRQETMIGFVNCTFHSTIDWTSNLYSFVAWRPKKEGSNDGNDKGEEYKCDFPDLCEFICPPVIHTDTNTGKHLLIALLQVCQKTMIRAAEGARIYDNVMFIHELFAKGVPFKTLKIGDLIKFSDVKDKFARIDIFNSNLVRLIYAKGVDYFTFDKSRGLVLPIGVEKGGILYDPKDGKVQRHIPCILDPTSDMETLRISKMSSIRVDNHLRVYGTINNIPVRSIKATLDFAKSRLALDGGYIIGLDKDRRSVQVYRTSDGQKMGKLFIHGRASCVEVGEDDRTIIIGCEDGRVLISTLVLEMSDPYAEVIKTLRDKANRDQGSVPLDHDVATVKTSKAELIRLSSKIRTDVKMAMRKQASFKSIASAVTLAQQMHHAKSQTCCVQ